MVLFLDEALIKEIYEYRRNCIKFIEDKLTFTHTARGIIPAKLYDFQKNAINLMLTKHFAITLKSRQIGASTIMQAYTLWCSLFFPNFKTLILSTGMRSAVRFLGDLRGMYERIPADYRLWDITENAADKKKHLTNNKTEIEFNNGSTILALPAQSPAARGASVNLLVIDEGAYIPGIEETFRGIFPTLSRAFKSAKGKPYGVIIISTPNGVQGDGRWYYEQYTKAVNRTSKFIPMRIHWSEVDEYDEAWYLEQCELLGWDYRAIQSELELSFLASGDTYIPGRLLNMIKITDPIKQNEDESLWVFKDPEPDKKYIMGVDFAYATGHDASAIQVLDAFTLEQVAEFLSPTILTKNFASMIYMISSMYNNALINIERNAGGKILIEQILDEYPQVYDRLFRDTTNADVLPGRPKFGQLVQDKDEKIGTMVSGASRDIILSNMYNILIDRYLALTDEFSFEESEEMAKLRFLQARSKDKRKAQLKVDGIIKSERLLLQLQGFVRDKNGKPQGDKDDAVLSYAHALYLWSKTKQFLLTDMSKIIPAPIPEPTKSKFTENYNNQVLRSLNKGRSKKEIEQYLLALDEEDRNAQNEPKDKMTSFWESYLGI